MIEVVNARHLVGAQNLDRKTVRHVRSHGEEKATNEKLPGEGSYTKLKCETVPGC